MAYADYTDYTDLYYGNAIPESDFNRVAERAGDFMDTITFGRLAGGLPEKEDYVKKIKKCNCALADKYYLLELAEAQALEAVKGGESSSEGGSESAGSIKSRSAGSESISYETASEKASTAKAWSSALNSASDIDATNNMLYKTAKMYLTGVKTDKGDLLLYAGMR